MSGHSDIVLPDVRMNIATPKAPVVARIRSNELCTSPKASGWIRHVEFDVSGTDLVGACLPGQAVGVLTPGEDDAGKAHKVRLYSLASPGGGETGDGTILSTTVKRLLDEHWETNALFVGVASNYLCNLRAGDPVRLTGPSGRRFLLPANPGEHDFVFVATGTGVAPFRGMVLDLLGNSPESRVCLVTGSPYETDLPYDDVFRALDESNERFTYLTALSRQPQRDGDAGPMYADGRLPDERIAPMLRNERTLVYLCGIAGMEVGVYRQLATLLGPDDASRYLNADPSTLGAASEWDRATVKSSVKPTGRVFVEVY